MPSKPKQKVRGVYEQPKGSGIWWCISYTPERRRERVGRWSDAVALHEKRRSDFRAGIKLPSLRTKRTTFGELIDDAITFANENHKNPRDIQNKGELARKKLGPLFAADITFELLEAWIKRRKVEPATFNRYKAFFSLCFREGIRNKKVAANPAKMLRRKREPEGRKRYLKYAEYPVLMAKIDSPKHPERRVAVITSLLSGMRKGEQFSLEWPQVDFDRDEINLTQTKNGDDRSIPMGPELRKVLNDHWERAGSPRKGKVFPRPRGGQGDVQLDWFDTAVTEAKLDNYTWHNNRHTFCSWYMMGGGELLELKAIAGHKTLSMTARYAHLSPGHLRSGIGRLSLPRPTEQPVSQTAT